MTPGFGRRCLGLLAHESADDTDPDQRRDEPANEPEQPLRQVAELATFGDVPPLFGHEYPPLAFPERAYSDQLSSDRR